jgi:hypothetical protein
MDKFSKSINMFKHLLIASITVFSPLTAIAQTNGSNSSGSNTTSFTGVPGSIWSGDRSPIVVPTQTKVINNQPIKVISLPVQPKELIIVPTQTKVITAPPVKPQTKPQTKPRPKYVKSKHPRARG